MDNKQQNMSYALSVHLALRIFILGILFISVSLWQFSQLKALSILGLSVSSSLVLTMTLWLMVIRDYQRQLNQCIQLGKNLSLNQEKESDTILVKGPFKKLQKTLLRKQKQIRRHYKILRISSDRMRQIYQQSNDAIFIIEPDKMRILDCNPMACNLLKQRKDQLLTNNISDIFSQVDRLESLITEAVNQAHSIDESLQLSLIDIGNDLNLHASASHLSMDNQQLVLLVTQDISAQIAAKDRIYHLAYHDTLTDLPNRTLLTDRVNNALKRTQRSKQIGALLFLDLDNFKRINDSLGHSIGDLLLQELASRLKATLRDEDTVSRLGGDEFVVLIENLGINYVQAEDQIHEVANKIKQMLNAAYNLNGHELHVTASIGFVSFPRDGETMETLLRHADMAMYQSKDAGRNTVTSFDQSMDDNASKLMRIEQDVRQAMRDNQFELYFQPVLGIRDGEMLGAEALLRWIHPRDGEIKPDDFLPQIADSALMLTLADWVLREAFVCSAEISNNPDLLTPDYVAINLSHHQFHQPNFVDDVKRLMHETHVDPKQIQFEITETIIMSNTLEARKRMLALKKLGITFAIDDFGTGYSSLSHLKQLPADTLKIDKSFVRDITSDKDDAAIVKTILSMANHLGLRVIAEGVEYQDQLQFLRDNGCTYYQGYLGRQPLNRTDFFNDLRQSSNLRLVKNDHSL